MTLQVIVATMHQTDHSLLDRMNIQSDAIVCNQCDRNEVEEFEYNGHHIKWLSFAERGVGLNRNNGLMRATADIVLFADDDLVYLDGYVDTIVRYYQNNSAADVVVFNVAKKRDGETQFTDCVRKDEKLSKRSATKFGTYSFSARREILEFVNVVFHRNFGGGAKYSCGEDTLFLQDCLKKKLRVYATTEKIGNLVHGESTWFYGYNDKYFFDKGVLYYMIDRRMAKCYALYHCFKHKKLYSEYGWKNAYKKMCEGIKSVKK